MKCLAQCLVKARFAVVALLVVAATRLVVPGELALAQTPSTSKTTHAADTSKLDVDSLKSMLEQMGYEPVEQAPVGGVRSLTISEKRKGGTYSLGFFFSKDQNQLWIFASLGNVEADRKIPADVMIEMLNYNHISRYMKFSFSKQKRQFRLEGVIPNDRVTPALLRSMIEESLDVLPKTWKLWWPAYWPTQEVASKKS